MISINSKYLMAVYIVTGIAALILTSLQLPTYMGSGFIEGTILFWQDAIINSNPAGKFLLIDISLLTFVCCVWMFIEGRRENVKFLYAYLLGGIFIGISVAFPLFMAARELRVASNNGGASTYQIKKLDFYVLSLMLIGSIVIGIALA